MHTTMHTTTPPHAPFLATLQFDGPHDEAACLVRTNPATGLMEILLLGKPDNMMTTWINTTSIMPDTNTVWTHKKRGSEYAIIGLAELTLDGNDHKMIVYSDRKTGRPWVRQHKEFLDGRFVRSQIEPAEDRANNSIDQAVSQLIDAIHTFEKTDDRRSPLGLFDYGTAEQPLAAVRDHEAEDIHKKQINLYIGPDHVLARIIYEKALIGRTLRLCGTKQILTNLLYNYMTDNVSPPGELPFARFETLLSEGMTEQQIRTITDELNIEWRIDSTDLDQTGDEPLKLDDALAVQQPSWALSDGWTLSSIWETDEGTMIRRYIRPLSHTSS